MKGFIEVYTTNTSGFMTTTLVNINNVSHIIKISEGRCSIIYVGGTDDNYSTAMHSYEEIIELIKNAI